MSDPKRPDEDAAQPAPGSNGAEPPEHPPAPEPETADPDIAAALAEASVALDTGAQATPAEEEEAWEEAWDKADEEAELAAAAAAELRARRAETFFENLAFYAPFAIVAYCLALAALRLGMSPFLEVDESEFVGRVDFRLIYDNAHPPLFNWLMRILLNLTGWSWPDAVSILRFGLLGAFHYLTWRVARQFGGPRAGALALAASAFLPQIVWMSVHTLAHSIMVLTGAAAVLFCLLRALRKPDWSSYAWLGAAMSLGALAKFNFFLLLVPLLAAFALDAKARALFTHKRAWAAPAVFAAISGPSLIAALVYLEDSGSRIGKLYQDNKFSWLDLPYLGVDGFVSLLIMTLAWAGPAALIWLAARAYDRHRGALAAPVQGKAAQMDISAAELAQVLERALLIGMALYAVLILAGDVSKIEERYLTPLLALTPVYLALRWPLSVSARPVVLTACAAYLAVFAGFWGYATYGKHRFAIPYDAVASQIRRQHPEPAALLTPRHSDRANIAIALGWPGAVTPSYQELGEEAVLVWPGRGDAPAGLAPQGFGPATPIATVAAPYRNRSGLEAIYSFQVYEKTKP